MLSWVGFLLKRYRCASHATVLGDLCHIRAIDEMERRCDCFGLSEIVLITYLDFLLGRNTTVSTAVEIMCSVDTPCDSSFF